MGKFNIEQALVAAEVQQLINDWAHDLDVNNGLNIAGLVTEDCNYVVGGVARRGMSCPRLLNSPHKAGCTANVTCAPRETSNFA